MLFKWLSNFFGMLKSKITGFKDFFFLTPNKDESFFQYTIRSFMFPNGDGSMPSWTYTLVVWFSIWFGCMLLTDVFVFGKTLVREFDPATGHIIKEYVRGISMGAWGLATALTGAVIFFIKFRDQRNASKIAVPEPTEEDKKDPSIVDTLVNTIKENVTK